MAKVRWTLEAQSDLRDIVTFISRDSEANAATLGRRLVEATRRLEHFPHLGRMVHEYQSETLREIVVASYRIVYAVEPDGVGIVGIAHGRQSLTDHLAERPLSAEQED